MRSRRGDTIIEVLLAISIFSLVSLGAIFVMNRGIATTQESLEVNLVRNQIDSQAELLRHFNAAYLVSAGRTGITDEEIKKADNDGKGPAAQWITIQGLAATQADTFTENIPDESACRPGSLGGGAAAIPAFNKAANTPGVAFFIDPTTGLVRSNPVADFRTPGLQAKISLKDPSMPHDPTSNPNMSSMLWIQAVRVAPVGGGADIEGRDKLKSTVPGRSLSDFYDFHIRACWSSPRGNGVMTLGTIVRLYVPKN